MSFHSSVLFFFNDTATTEIYTLSLHDALPISILFKFRDTPGAQLRTTTQYDQVLFAASPTGASARSEEHTSELQSRLHLVCRLLLEKKKKNIQHNAINDTRHRHRISIGPLDGV